jgi:hypothetical protein
MKFKYLSRTFTRFLAPIVAVGAFTVTNPAAAQDILTFDFAALTGSEATAGSNFNNAGLTSATISRGSGLTASANAARFNATNWALTSIDNAVTGNNYMEFTVTPNAGQKFTVTTITVQWQRSATGNTAIALRSSLDSYAADIGGVKTVVDNTSTQTFTWTVNQGESTAPVTYRFYSYAEATGGSGGPGDGTGNDIVVSGTVNAASANAPSITSPLAASGTAFTSFTYQIEASNTPTSFGATGLPPGLTVDTATGVISGAATVPGEYTVTITATNAEGTGSAPLALSIAKNAGAPTISSALTASAVASTAFEYQIEASNNPTSYNAANLPTGLTIDTSTGLISGTPTTGGVRNVTITASNDLGSDSQTLVITVNTVPTITSTLSASSYTGSAFSYQITSTGTPAATSFGATGLPAGLNIDAATGIISGTPTEVGTSTVEISATNTNGTGTASLSIVVLDQAAQNAIPLNIVVNKYANGSATTLVTVDKVQLLVVGPGAVDMRGMIIKDFSTNMANDNGGKFVFTADDLWSAVPSGTLVTLSSGTTQTEDVDSADYALAVNLGNTTYFTNGGGSFDISTTEMIMIKAAGTGLNGVAGGIHALAGGTPGAQFNNFTGAKLIASGTSAAGFGVIANNATSALVDYGTSGAAASTDATGSIDNNALDFASWNNAANQIYIESLRGAVPPNPYNSWASGFGLDPAVTTGPTAGAPTADPDGDSFTNAQEYAFGTNPTQGNGALLSTTSSGGNLTVIWLQRGDVTYTPQSTANLATTPFANDFSVTVVNGPVEPAPPAGYISRQFTVTATGNKFYRVTGTTP